jgi:hypothetical protein
MTRAFFRAGLALVVAILPVAALAVPEADPAALYAQMKDAYTKAALKNWDFADQQYYLSTIFNAGRAYSLQRPDDPAYGELATIAVRMAAALHYDPLTNHDAATWYVREAAVWVQKNSGDADRLKDAQFVLDRVNAEGDVSALARFADEDAAANIAAFPGDPNPLLEQLEANWRGWLLTGDRSWRSLAFERAAAPGFPIEHLPTTFGPDFLRAVGEADAGVAPGYTEGDRHNAAVIQDWIKHLTTPLVIASVKSMPHDAYLTTLAPADEYFGRMGYSVLGIENELKHINFMLDYNYGNREASTTVLVAESIDDMHKVYPRDRDMPKLLLDGIRTLDRMDAPDAKAADARLRAILTVEYQDSPEARQLLDQDSPSAHQQPL